MWPSTPSPWRNELAPCHSNPLLRPPDQDDSGASVYRLVRSAGGEAAAAKLRIHHSSVLFRCRPQWVCFYAAEQNDTGWWAQGAGWRVCLGAVAGRKRERDAGW